jgi:hypothetical protein
MYVFRHDDIGTDEEVVTSSYSFKSVFEQVSCFGCSKVRSALMTGEGNRVEMPRVVVTHKVLWHG